MTAAENLIPVAAVLLALAALIGSFRSPAGAASAELDPSMRRLLLAAWLIATSISIYIHVGHFEMLGLNDDSFITYRYSENFAAGHGLVYNEGERVFGTTTILYSMLLGVLKFGSPSSSVESMSILLNLGLHALATLLTLFYVAPLLHRWDPRLVLPSLVFFLTAVTVSFEFTSLMYGSEVGLLVFLVACALTLLRQKRLILFAVVLFLIFMTRIDTVIFLGLTCLYLLFARDIPIERRLAALACFGILSILGIALATLYFGSFIPNTIVAKDLVYRQFGAAGRGAFEVADYFSSLFDDLFWGSLEKRILFLLFLTGAAGALRKRQYELLLAAGAVVGYFVLLASFQIAMKGYWYTPQYMLLYYMVCCVGFSMVVNLSGVGAGRIGPRLQPNLLRGLFAAGLIALVALPAVGTLRRKEVALHKGFMTSIDLDPRICVGHFLSRLQTEVRGAVLVGDIGKVGYYSDAYILDMRGLVSPQVFPYYRDGSGMRGIIMGERPIYIQLNRHSLSTNVEKTNVDPKTFDIWFNRFYEELETGCGLEQTVAVFARRDRLRRSLRIEPSRRESRD